METCTEHHAGTSSRMPSKWRLVGWYWAAQGVFVMAAMLVATLQADTVNGHEGRPLGHWDVGRVGRVIAEGQFWGAFAVVVVVLMVLQAILVWPVRRPRYRRQRGWPLWMSLGAGALVGCSMAAGLLLALTNIWSAWDRPAPDWYRVFGGRAFLAWCAVSYIVGFVLMHRFCRRGLSRGDHHECLLGRIAATLFIGTLIEALAIMPLDVMFRRKQDCYSFAGSFWAYILLLGAGLVTLGPAVFLPLLARRRKRWYAGRCDCCGYDMTGLIGVGRVVDRCPECGAGWKADAEAPA